MQPDISQAAAKAVITNFTNGSFSVTGTSVSEA